MPADSPVVVVANRLPVDQVTDPDGTTRWQRSPGGLVTALEPFVAGRGGAWVGWSGSAGDAPEPFESANAFHIQASNPPGTSRDCAEPEAPARVSLYDLICHAEQGALFEMGMDRAHWVFAW